MMRARWVVSASGMARLQLRLVGDGLTRLSRGPPLPARYGRWGHVGFPSAAAGASAAANGRPEADYTACASFSRLWAVQTSRHLSATFARPRNRNWRKPRAALIWPKTGSTVCLRRR